MVNIVKKPLVEREKGERNKMCEKRIKIKEKSRSMCCDTVENS